MRTTVVALAVVAASCLACSSGESPSPEGSESSGVPSEPTSTSTSSAPALVGRWERVTTCEDMVEALDEEGLASLAPAMLAGNGLVSGGPKQLARKDDICEGAVPREHAHFFTATGEFGSLDYNNQQVDDGPYEIGDDNTVFIGGGPSEFKYRITEDGQTLSLDPVIPASDKRQALADPLEFSGAGWSVAVAFPGYTWERVDCDGWC